MARTPRQKYWRFRSRGLLGVHEYQTAYGLIARKLGKLSDQIDDAVLRRGRLLEPVAKRLIAEKHPDWQLIEPTAYYSDSALKFGCTPDLFVKNERGIGVVQIKTVHPSTFAKKWRNDAGAIEPPLWIAIQAMSEQHLTMVEFAMVAAMVIDYGLSLELIDVPYIAGVIETVRGKVGLAWEMIEAGELPPPDFGTDRANLAAVYRQDDGTEIDLTGDNELPEIISEFEALKMARETAQAGVKNAEARILDRLGNAQRARFAGGVITFKTQHRKGYVVEPTSFRKLSVKHNREDAA